MDPHALAVVGIGLAVFGVLGLLFGLGLAGAAVRFHVPENPLVERVRARLPSANCAACGFAGCQAYAEAVVARPEVAPSLCIPGGTSVAQALAALTGKTAGEVADRIVALRCHGTLAYARAEAAYAGIRTCAAAALVFGGPRACKHACLGLGDCVRSCPFDALHLGPDGLPEVDAAACTGCAVCVAACPKELLRLVPRDRRVELACVAREKQAVVRAACQVGCTLCRKCVAKCPAGAIAWSDGTIVVDHGKCREYGPACGEACVDVCPSTILHRVGQRPRPEPAAPAAAAGA